MTHVLFYLSLIQIRSVCSTTVLNIINATYSAGSSFINKTLATSSECLCSCISHPHCLSISAKTFPNNTYYCQLFATYPVRSSDLSMSLTSNVTIYTRRTLNSVYINNGTHLSHPTSLALNSIDPWIPVFKLYAGNNQSFLWLNSSNLTTLVNIPAVSINQTASHWFSVLLSEWNQLIYTPSEVAIAFIINRTVVLDFLTFNASQSDITTWFSTKRLLTTQYWQMSAGPSANSNRTLMNPVYSDSDCTRSFSCNYKYSTSGCRTDFYGFFFLHGGYNDSCIIAAVQNLSKITVPSIYYTPTTFINSGNFSNFNLADGLMGFVR